MRSTALPAGPDIAPGYLQAIDHCPMLSAETVSNLGVVWVGLDNGQRDRPKSGGTVSHRSGRGDRAPGREGQMFGVAMTYRLCSPPGSGRSLAQVS